MKYLLDTNVLSDFARGEQAVTARLRQEAPPQLAVSVITELEVEYGLARNPNLAPPVREAMRTLLTRSPSCRSSAKMPVSRHNCVEA